MVVRMQVVGVVIAIAALGGCSSTPSPEAPADGDPSNVAAYVPVGEGGDAALLDAEIVAVEPCVVVEDSLGSRFVPIFPTDRLAVSDGVASFDGVMLDLGVTLSLGGGTASAPPTGAYLPVGCTGDFWQVTV